MCSMRYEIATMFLEGDTAAAFSELDQAELKRKALEMRRDGLGYKSIAGALGVGIKRVRNAVDDIEKGIEGHTQ